jgi:hypothetical protein
MPTIFVDDEVFAAIQAVAIPFVDKAPNETLRRHFGLSNEKSGRSDKGNGASAKNKRNHKRSPKIHYQSLIDNGDLRNGQVLYPVDSMGKRLPGEQAEFTNGRVRYNGGTYSLSTLADNLLRKHGKKSPNNRAARGPKFFATETGTTLEQIWNAYLALHPGFSY